MSDEILFLDETDTVDNEQHENDNWKVLIVDDEKEIHFVTSHVLKDFSFKEKGIDFLHAYSGEEAKEVIAKNPDISLIFLDVVMETDDAGLNLVSWIREVQENRFVRIVLRTGQPGLAPVKKVILEYDIDDYRSKTELTAVRLFTTTVASLRSYTIMMDQEENRRVLEALVKASWSLNSARTAESFLDGILPQISAFMAMGENSFFSKIIRDNNSLSLPLVMGSGRFKQVGSDANTILNEDERGFIKKALNEGHHVFDDQIVVGVLLQSDRENSRLIFIESYEKIKSLDISALKIFLSSIDSAYSNMILSSEVEEAHLSQINMQRGLLDRLNNVISLRSKETAGHVRRVAEVSGFIAREYGCDNEYINLLRTASPMHDIGKVGVPDSILLKPGKLTPEERAIIETHATIGRGMFENDDSPLINMARDVAGCHHEKWDGSGYPEKLKGEEIPLSGRITALCDVFDALASARPYKDPLPIDKVMDIIREESGKAFEPRLVSIFLENRDTIVDMFNKYQ